MRVWLHRGLSCRIVAALALFCATAFQSAAPQAGSLTADQVKAGFIYNFTRYIEWPKHEDVDPEHFHLCIAGYDAVVDELVSTVHGKATGGRLILVRFIKDDNDVKGCEILYVGDLGRTSAKRLAEAVNDRPILTVGSVPRFLRDQGIITFVIDEGRVRFDINHQLAERLKIRFESRILALARRTAEVSQ